MSLGVCKKNEHLFVISRENIHLAFNRYKLERRFIAATAYKSIVFLFNQTFYRNKPENEFH